MSLKTVLSTIGKDLGHVGTWIEDGLAIAGKVVTVIDPPIGAIITEAETILAGIIGAAGATGTTPAPTITAATVQQLLTALGTIAGIKSAVTTSTPAPTT